jgi:hypothetical protein
MLQQRWRWKNISFRLGASTGPRGQWRWYVFAGGQVCSQGIPTEMVSWVWRILLKEKRLLLEPLWLESFLKIWDFILEISDDDKQCKISQIWFIEPRFGSSRQAMWWGCLRERGDAAKEGWEWPNKLWVGEVDGVDTASDVGVASDAVPSKKMNGISVISAPKSLTHVFFFWSMGNLVISMLKLRAFASFFVLIESRAQHMTNFHPYKRYKLTDEIKKQAVDSLEGWNARFGSLGCHPENWW